jgi:TolB protein
MFIGRKSRDHRMGKRGFILVLLAGLMFFAVSAEAGDYGYISITNPSFNKTPIAVPVFKAAGGQSNELALAVRGADLLEDMLDFTGYFTIVDRNKFLFDPQRDGVAPTEINYNNWTVIGAELLVTGVVTTFDGLIEVDLRLMDTYKAGMLLGKKYKGTANDYRDMIKRFCNEIVLLLTGKEGIFNSRIAFLSTGTGNKEIYICEFDGFAPRQLTRNNDITLFPAWSSDGNWMAYTSYKNKRPDLFIRDLKGTRETAVSKNGINTTPAWVPGTLELAATFSFSGDQEIYLLTKEGKIIKNLTNSKGIDSSPTFSPDGRQMAFVSKRSGTPQVFIMEMNSGISKRLTYSGQYNTQPSWSPAGDKIAYTAMEGGATNIMVINADGSGQTQLTNGGGYNESPTWSPDGSLIAFSSTKEGPSRIFVMTARGTDAKRLLSMPGEQTNPKWSP